MKKFHILLIVVLGFFLMPTATFACGMDSGKHCKKEASSKTDKDDCCESNGHSKSKNGNCCGNNGDSTQKKHNGCGGKCGHSGCGCALANAGVPLFYELEFKGKIISFSFSKQKFYNTETFISSGFYSLWLIPKIS